MTTTRRQQKKLRLIKCRKEEVEVLQMVLRLLRSGVENYDNIHAALVTFEVHHDAVFPARAVKDKDGEWCGRTQQFLSKVYPSAGQEVPKGGL